MKILKRSLISACICEGLSILLVVKGTRAYGDTISSTWYCKLGLILHWPGMKVEDHVSGDFMNWAALVGVPLILWLLAWLAIWFFVEKFKTNINTEQPLSPR